jgi:uncharacterized membrane protein
VQSKTADGRERSAWTRAALESFSDGVFAVAITLLVFGIGVPAAGTPLANQLRRETRLHA